MMNSLKMEDVEIQGKLCIRPYNVGQRVPKITRIPQLDKLREAIESIKETDNLDLLAHWPEYGSATFDQLEAMANVLEARNRFHAVQFPLDWIDGVDWQVRDVLESFTDCSDLTKHVADVQVEGSLGFSLVDFRENLWLHSSSIISAMLALQQMYPGVDVVTPSYHEFAGLITKKKTAGGFGAFEPSKDRITAVICLDHHWDAYLVDKRRRTCYTFDPLQLQSNLAALKSSVQAIIEPLVGLKDELVYEEIKWCEQKDSSSCGLWCLVVLEFLLADRKWDDCLYELQSYLCLRYLFKAIGVQQCVVVHEEE